jgi:hypothetical protein
MSAILLRYRIEFALINAVGPAIRLLLIVLIRSLPRGLLLAEPKRGRKKLRF